MAKRIVVWVLSVGLVGVATLVGYATFTDAPGPSTPPVAWQDFAKGPTQRLGVYWVGHSLFNHRDPTVEDAPHLMEEVGRLAAAAGVDYASFDHTLYGANLSLAARGEAHSYSRQEPELAERGRELDDHGSRYGAMVLTEGVPVRNAEHAEHSSYYLQQLACRLWEQNPDARVYLYESPVNLQAGDVEAHYGPRDEFGWASWMEDDREVWERIADQASTGRVAEPGLGPRVRGLFGSHRERACEHREPIFLIPTATVMQKLRASMEQEPAGGITPRFRSADGSRLTIAHLFQNPYMDWPAPWPLPPDIGPSVDEGARIAELTLLHAGQEPDDIHPSRIGTYVAALTAFAVLYRRSPEGLPTAPGVSEASARELQTLVWETVVSEPRAGVRP